MAIDSNADLTTTQLAQRTGVSAGTLRMWESRHGFPSPVRLPGRHHRYSESDVDAVHGVLRLREQGLSLTAAIDRARASDRPPPESIFAGLRQCRPDLQPVALSKRALLGLTRATEDEYCAQAASGLLIASFQRVHFYRQVERRWRELSRAAQIAVVLADFSAVRAPEHAPVEVPVAREHPLAREWTLVIDAPGAQACLSAWEHPSSIEPPDELRRFEVLWSFEPEVVRAAALIAAELVSAVAPTVAGRLRTNLHEPAAASPPELRFATGLAHRMVGYLATGLDGRASHRQAGLQ